MGKRIVPTVRAATFEQRAVFGQVSGRFDAGDSLMLATQLDSHQASHCFIYFDFIRNAMRDGRTCANHHNDSQVPVGCLPGRTKVLQVYKLPLTCRIVLYFVSLQTQLAAADESQGNGQAAK